MLARIKLWLTPPVFLTEPLKTRRADFLNITLLAILGFAPLLILGNLWGGHTPVLVTVLDFSVMLIVIGARYVLRRGHVELASIIMLVTGLTIVTLAAANLGTIRTPTTSAYLVIIIIAGAIFDWTGLLVAMGLSALALLGLVVAEMAGGLPTPDYTVTVTQWVTYSAVFASISLLSHFALRRTRQALAQADRELVERQRTEIALRQRDAQLREAQHLAQLGSWEWDLSAQTLSWSDEVYRIFGVTPDETTTSVELFESFLHPDDRDTFLRRRAQMLADMQTTLIDHRIVRRDGEVRWVQERGQVLQDEAGQATRVTGTVQDITERKQLELALRQSEVRYRSLFEDSPISLWEEDFSQVKQYLDALRQSGVTDLRTYLTQHPEAVNACVERVRVLDVNQATVDLLELPDKAAILSNLNQTLAAEAHVPFRDELCTLADGAQQWVMDEALRTATGGELFITVYVSIAPGYADTWGKVLVSILDITERKQAEEALRESEANLQLSLTGGEMGQWSVNLRTMTGAIDDRAAQILGYAIPSISGDIVSWDNLTHPDDLPRLQQILADHLAGKIPMFESEHRMRHASGEYRWISGRGKVTRFDTDGTPLHISGIMLDITERKQMEEALRKSETSLRAIFESSMQSFVMCDRDRRVQAFNRITYDRTCAYYGRGIRLGDVLDDYMPPQDRAGFGQDFERVLAGESLQFEYSFKLGDVERWFDFQVTPVYAEDRQVLGVFLSMMDITERKRAEEALRESQQMIEGIINTVPVRVFWKDKNLVYLGCNAAFARDAGVTAPADLIGKDDYQLGWRAQADLYRADDRQVIDSGCAKLHIEEPQTTPDGQTFTLLTNKVPLRNAQGEISGILGTYLDITERKQAEVAEHDQRQLAEALRDTAAALNSTLALTEVLDCILANVERIVPHEAANIMLIDDGVAHIVRSRGFIERGLAKMMVTDRFQVADVANMRYMVATGLPLAIPNVHNYPDWVYTPENPWVSSHVGAPLRLKDRVIGFLNLDTATSDFYTPLHAERLQAFADQAATAIENARLLEAEHGQRMLAEALRDTAAVLNNTLDLDEVFERILVNVERVVDHDTANLMLIDEHGVARIVRHRGYAERGLVEFAARVRLTVAAVPNLRHMVETGQPRVMPDVRLEPDWIDWPESHWIQSIASAPIFLKGQAIGFINLNSGTTNFYSTEHGERLQAFANQAAVAVENARLYEEIQQHAQTLEQRVQARTAELQIANEQLQELDRMKDEFMSRMSHELRTPLTSIKIYLELLETARPEKRDKYMKVLTREANRLHQLIEDVLTITQLSRDTLDVEMDNADVNQLLESRLPTWQEMAMRQSLTFQADLAAALPLARLDRLYTLQVITQLITNATNYTPAGSVTLSTAQVDEAGNNWITISVTDTGPGITPEDLPHIFERFYRGRAAADYKTPGTGVGLSISREIAQKVGGRLTVKTQVGVGSTFTLWLPVA